MKNLLDYVIFVLPVAIIVAVALGLHNANKSEHEALVSPDTSVYKHPTALANTTLKSPATANYRDYAMSEPFASKVPFELTPAAWMQMMNNMMNNIQMTQIMHQMAAMPVQMMNPMMRINPHGMLPDHALNPLQQPIDPKEYKKWYEQQQKLQQPAK